MITIHKQPNEYIEVMYDDTILMRLKVSVVVAAVEFLRGCPMYNVEVRFRSNNWVLKLRYEVPALIGAVTPMLAVTLTREPVATPKKFVVTNKLLECLEEV